MGTNTKFIWFDMVFKKLRDLGNIQVFCGQGEKSSSGFSPLVLLRGREGVLQNRNGKTTESGRMKVAPPRRIGVEFLQDFRRAWEYIWLNIKS